MVSDLNKKAPVLPGTFVLVLVVKKKVSLRYN